MYKRLPMMNELLTNVVQQSLPEMCSCSGPSLSGGIACNSTSKHQNQAAEEKTTQRSDDDSADEADWK